MVVFVLCFLTGILAVQHLTALPEIGFQAYIFCSAVIAAGMRCWKGVFFLTGIVWAIFFASIRLNDRLPEHLAGIDVEIQGMIADIPEHESNHIRFNLKVETAEKAVPSELRLTWYYPDQVVKAGQRWQFTVRLKPPHGNFNPGGFDYERWLFVEGIGATGYIRTKPEPKMLSEGSLLNGFAVWRQAIADRLTQTSATCDSLPMIKALTIGDGDSLSPQQWEVFRKTGTTHLMVISGSHIGLIAALVYLMTIKLWSRTGIMAWSPQKVAALSALAIAFIYAGLTGFSVPAQRAALMIAIAMLAIVSQRNTRPYSILALALFGVLLVDPLVVLSPGFWLSFIAVSLIIYTLGGRLKKPGFFLGAFKINWVTSIGLSPLLLFFFQQVSIISPLANLIAVPIIGIVIVPLALSATLLLFVVPAIAEKLFYVTDLALQGLWWMLAKMAELPLATISHSQPSWWALGFAVPGIIVLFTPKGMPSRWLGLVMLCPLVFTENEKIAPGTAELTLLDVGQGLSAVVQTANHTLVYDTGAKFSSTSDSGQSVVLPYLRSRGIEQVNTLIVSHGDNDHIGGASSLIETIETGTILTSVPQQLSKYTPVGCKAGQSWVWDKVVFTILSPESGQLSSENNNSCVLQIRSKQGSALLPGDIEAETESRLVETYGDKLKSNVLIAPHHGSQTSSTPGFLSAVQPNVILIPAGYRNQFGHPHEDVIRRYRDLPAEFFNNTQNGAVILKLDKQPKVQSWRDVEGKYWNYKQ
ncbi:MAG: DNA internalization-related competence protein ComEC/Rec2 [Methylococcaceae bacterium]|nr:DNA internalization-related competence protein ComEC/Rec2 [Methylococcaceae bacterium]